MERYSLAVLAGGESARMGFAKSALMIGGRPILQHLLERFAWPGPKLLVTAPGHEHPPGWESYDRELVDPVAGQGPLRGILTALEHATTPCLLVATLDMPLIAREHLSWLADRLASAPGAVGIMLRREDREHRAEPFPSAYRREAAAVIRQRIEANELAVHALSRCPGFQSILAPPQWHDEAWINLNRPSDVEHYLSSIPRAASTAPPRSP